MEKEIMRNKILEAILLSGEVQDACEAKGDQDNKYLLDEAIIKLEDIEEKLSR